MKKKLKVFITLILILSMITISNLTYAASTSYVKITASSQEVNVGDTVNVTVNVYSGSWGLTINGGGLDNTGDATGMAGQTSTQGNTTSSKTYTFKANSVGNYTITVNGDITDYDTDENISINQSVTITVKEKQETPKPDDGENNNTNNNENNNQNNNENNNENNNQNNTPQEPTFTETNKIMYVKSDCTSLNLREGPNKNYKSLGTLKTNEKVTVIAISNKGIRDWCKVRTEKGIEGYVAGNYLTDTEPEKNIESSIATLSNIKVTPGKLNETFSKNNLSYTMTVEADVDSVNVTATPTDDKAKVTITGNTGLKTGTDNEITIKVEAENGSTKTYKIKVTKLATEDEEPNIIEDPEEKKLGLSSLEIEGLKISPDFKSNVYEYKATLTDKTIEKLIVNAIATFEDSKVEITGADEIKNGENVITIIVTSANGEETVTYQVIVNKKEETVIVKTETKEKEDSLQNIIIALIAAIAIVALILVFVLIKRKEKGKPVSFYEDGDYNEPEEDNTYSKLEKEDTQESIQEDEDDDWGTPKRGFRSKFKKTGRHF